MELTDWEMFCDGLKAAGTAITRPECPSSPVDRAEGYRYLLGFLHSTLTGFVYDAGPESPAFVRIMDDVVKFGLDAPDGINSYVATVRDDITYRIWGNAGTVRYVGWQFMAEGRGTVANISLHDFDIREDGSFEIWVSRDRRDGNWVEMPEGANRIGMRQFQYDWRERYAEVHIEAVDAPRAMPRCLQQRPAPDAFAAALRQLGENFALQANFWVDFVHGCRAEGDNVVPPAILNPAIGGNLLQSANNGYWRLADDETLLIEFTPPEGHYWSVCLGNFWFETIEPSHHQTSINGHQAQVDDDGCCRIVVAHADPGVANWLATVGHDHGTMTFRWLLCEEVPNVVARVVRVDDLDDVLPPRTKRVDAAEREAQLAVRRESVARRFGLPLTTRWSYHATGSPKPSNES
jgi:hypothetical protein